MHEETIWEKVKRWIGDRAFSIVLWSNGMTELQYMSWVHDLEVERRWGDNSLLTDRSQEQEDYDNFADTFIINHTRHD